MKSNNYHAVGKLELASKWGIWMPQTALNRAKPEHWASQTH